MTAHAHSASGDGHSEQEFEVLYREMHPKVLAYARKHFGSDAEDIAAETMIRAMQALRGSETIQTPLAWMYVVARRVACDVERGNRHCSPADPTDFGSLLAPAESEPEARVLADELAGMVSAAMADLSNAERALVRFRLIEELSHDQIAEALGITCQVVRKQFSRARRRLAAVVSAGDQDLGELLALADARSQTTRPTRLSGS